MATKRQRGASWEFVVRRKGLLPKPLYLTFANESEGDRYCAQLEALLDRGIVPPEVHDATDEIGTIAQTIIAYKSACALKDSEIKILDLLIERIGSTRLAEIDYQWTEAWVKSMKRARTLAPSTIRHHVGALARCLDWVVRRHSPRLPTNPLRLLPRGYATYNTHDAAAATALGKEVPVDTHRNNRRLEPGEEPAIRAILAGAKPADKQRALTLNHRAALTVLFDLALETAMRLSEMYTLTWGQIDLAGRTIYLMRTKNGSERQVPLTSVALRVLTDFRPEGSVASDQVFPWWDGVRSGRSYGQTTSLLSRQFARIFAAAGCDGLGFHRLRHEAICRLYERTKLDTTVIRKIVGHMSASAHDGYLHLRASHFADQLW